MNGAEWTEKNLRDLTTNSQAVLRVFAANGIPEMTTEEISKETEVKGQALGGVLSAFSLIQNKEWLLRKKAKRVWEFNIKYTDLVKSVVLV